MRSCWGARRIPRLVRRPASCVCWAVESTPGGAAPFGNCDMNSANGFHPGHFAAACGIEIDSPAGILTAHAKSARTPR
ncbi:hypothetical protein EAH80_17835 [Mycobacterium hodleri]|uniref:Uncharacterized protein n=1 Tax=Mycolicibacterium hodleri TaxID=49897 RepID=A0A502E5Q1_9MYCO|nr:hypothetical protein EAH80_17835 [Mycolicibacterium hodleri]